MENPFINIYHIKNKIIKYMLLKNNNTSIKITTWNINSVRKRIESIKVFVKDFAPDILLLQETKVNNELFPCQFFKELGYQFAHYDGEKTGYNGVAILAKQELEILPKISFIKEARHLAVKTGCGIEIHNFYIPAGGDIPDPKINQKFEYKLNILDQLKLWFEKEKKASNKIVLTGDLNIAPLENDVWSHKQLLKIVSHTPIEVEKLANLYNSINFKDAVRKFTPESEKLYSWWSYRAKDWQKANKGRRLDHIWVTKPLYQDVIHAEISQYTRGLDTPSDHVPVSVTISVDKKS